jgi:chromate transport protein ChrA
MKAWLAVALIVSIDVLLCVAWLGPYWFILIAGIFCLAFVVVSLCQAAGDADRRIEEMFDYHVEHDEDGNEVLVTVTKGRGTTT